MSEAAAEPVRCAVLPPAPVPYREPLYGRLVARGRLRLTVIYVTAEQPSWDMGSGWFGAQGAYDSVHLRSWQRPRRRPGRTPIAVPRGLWRELERLDPRCVVSWEFGPATLLALLWCRLRGRALVIFSELPPQADEILSAPQRRLHRLVAPRVDGFVVASSAAKRRAVSLGAPAETVEVSLQSAEVERFRGAAVARREHPPARPLRVLCVARLVPDKNLQRLLAAWARAGIGGDEAELELCGTGPLEGELRGLADELGVPVRFRGYLAPADLPTAYAESDAFALVSTFEPFGVAVREAAAAGLPLLCSDVAGAAGDIAIGGRNALLVDPSDEDAIATALGSLVGNRELRLSMARQSDAVTAERDPEHDAEAFERAVLGAAERRGASDRSC